MKHYFQLLLGLLVSQYVSGQDLTADISLSSSKVICGESYGVQATVKNIGLNTAFYYKTGYYVSKDTKIDARDIQVYISNPITTRPGNTFSESGEVKIPYHLPAGTYYLFMIADVDNVVKETNEKNNYRYRTIEIIPGYVDLSVSALSLRPGPIIPGRSFTINATETTAGNASAGEHEIYYYLSKDLTIGSEDALLWKSNIGKSYPGSQVFSPVPTIPASTTPGDYYLIAIIDPLKTVRETDENNNVTSIPLAVSVPMSDIATTDFKVYPPNPSTPGSEFSASTTVKNVGNVPVSDPSYKIYFSDDSIISSDDDLIRSSNGSLLKPGESISFSNHDLIIPVTAQPGTKYVIFQLLSGSSVDHNPANNVRFSKLVVEKGITDIETTPVTAGGTELAPGSSVKLELNLINNGTQKNTVSVGYFLSADSLLDNTDVLLRKVQAEVYRNSSYGLDYTVQIDSNTAFGNYYLLVAADYENLLSEDNETNNVSATPVTIAENTADLFIRFTNKNPIIAKPGGEVEYSFTNYNKGKTHASRHIVTAYISKDTLLDSGDLSRGWGYSRGLNGSDSATFNWYDYIPNNFSPGVYYMLVVTDLPESQIVEINENNNLDYRKIIVQQADVDYTVVADIFGSNQLTRGEDVTVQATVFNTGSDNGGYHNLQYYLSADSIPESSEKVGWSQGMSVYGGSSYSVTNSFQLSYRIQPGNYFIIAKADDGNSVAETNESNNLSFIPVRVVVPFTDLRIEANKETYTKAPGEHFDVFALIYNDGTLHAAPSYTGVFISSDSILEGSDRLINELLTSNIYPESHTGLSTSVAIPWDVTSGNYFLIFKADNQNEFAEPDEANNYHFDRLVVQSGDANLRTASEGKEIHRTEVSVYPNPTDGTIRFNTLAGADALEIYDATGAARLNIQTSEIAGGHVDLSKLGAGIYSLKLKRKGELVSALKVVLTR